MYEVKVYKKFALMHGTLFLSAKHRKPLNKIFAIVLQRVCTEKVNSSVCICIVLYNEHSALVYAAWHDLYADLVKEISPSSI